MARRKENSLQYRVAQGLDSDVGIKAAKAGKVYDHRTGGALVRDDILHFPGAAYLATDETEGGEKTEKDKMAQNGGKAAAQIKHQRIDWRAVFAFRPQAVLSGEMWLKSFIAGFVALCAGVIIVVFVFPLGAAWAASAAFLAVIVIVALIFTLLG